ncbi:LCP family protein [Bifidobacterium tissieri]|uniref:Transcriptional regulator n=1 Tax=Bifidobacterium tissieri TaxID=1630162 RepID=A0A5M9ZT70_9BIFI|nr:LCP family protein [Bifidobacterium tissieri]KAA8830821.1 transcriptional regulator [Bifidobacterium tissieri]KAA8832833.1 transcriptional regulator [Bifidobacterium tissieri]
MSHRLRTTIALVLVAIFTFVATATGATATNLFTLINDSKTAVLGQAHVKTNQVIDPNAGKTVNILVLGQDTREGEANAAIGAGGSATDHQSDTAMIVQISADRSFINIVSIPRDSIVNAPSCNTTNGTVPARYNVQFNSIFALGYSTGGDVASAASCTLNAVNSLTGLDISQFVVADFAGLSSMIDAVGGVDICVNQTMKDDTTGIDLTQGLHHLDGVAATQYARVRHVGDGTDIMRTTRQQYLVKSLLREASSKNLFTQTNQLYQLATAGIQSLKMSDGLADAGVLVGLGAALKNLDTDKIYAQTVPVTEWSRDRNRVVWTADADSLWKKLADDKPLTLTDDSDSEDSGDSEPSDESSSAAPSESPSASDTPSNSPEQSNSASPSPSDTASADSTPDPKTGLITKADGTLVDPNTGGIVDPKTGTIRDPVTSQAIGIADAYVNSTFCAVTEKE